MRKFLIILILSLTYSCRTNNFSDFQSLQTLNSDAQKAKIKELTGERIKEVTYVIANYQERKYQFDNYDLVDEAIFFKLSNNKYLSWVWTDVGPESGYYYGLYIGDLSEALKRRNKEGIEYLKSIGVYEKGIESNWKNVSESKNWKSFVGKEIRSFDFEIIKDQDGRTHISNFKLLFDDETIDIYSIEEPDPENIENLENLDFAPDWSIVIFNTIEIGK